MPQLAAHVSLVLAWLALPFVSSLDPEFVIQQFKTEPSFRVPKVTVLNITEDRSLLQPGYIFLDSTFSQTPALHGGTGPMIVDVDGNLVWSGAGIVTDNAWRTQHSHVCDYMGEVGTHFCTTETIFWTHELFGKTIEDDQYGVHRVFNQQYEQVSADHGIVTSGFSSQQYPDQHEFSLVDKGKNYLQLIYHPTEIDMTSMGGASSAPIVEGCFQDIDVATDEPVFHFCGLDHFPISDSVHATADWVLEPKATDPPWDWMHLNSADKNEEGDYLLSVRYFNQVLKVAGPNAMAVHGVEPGTILWRLGGPSGNVETSPEIDFMFQHDARYISTSKTETIITVFDNFKEEVQQLCSAKMIKVNNETMQAELIRQWKHPDGIGCDSMGSARVLPNGNIFIGWGNQALYSEFAPYGELLYHATFVNPGTSPLETYNYRSIKAPWIGKPNTTPKVLAYLEPCDGYVSPLVAYVSWNGATEVAMWSFSTSLYGSSGPWVGVGQVAKDGFETRAMLKTQSGYLRMITGHPRYIRVKALDKDGNILGDTITELSNSPEDREMECLDGKCYAKGGNTSGSCGPKMSLSTTGTSLVLLIAAVALVVYVFRLAPRLVRLIAKIRTRRQSTIAWEQEAPLMHNKYDA